MLLIGTNASDKEFYAILGLPETATEEEIRASFRNLCRHHHPDIKGDNELFLRAKHAHDILIHPEKRAIYDETGLDPDDTERKIDIAALGLIRSIAMGILSDGNADANLVVHIQAALQQDLTGRTAQLRKAEQRIKKSEKMLANIEKRWKNGASQAKGAIAGMISAQIQAAQGDRAQAQQGIDVVTLAVKLMEGADWEMEMPKQYSYGVDPGGSSWTVVQWR